MSELARACLLTLQQEEDTCRIPHDPPPALPAPARRRCGAFTTARQIPPEYGGSSPDHLGQSHEERALNKLAASLGPTSLPKGTMGTVASASHAPAATGGSSGDARDDAANGHGEEAEAEEADAWVTSSRHGDDATGGDYVREDGTGGSHGQGASALREGSSVSSTVGRARGVGSADGGGASAAGMGMSQRLASVVRRMRGRATQAYLGVENKFRYDTEHRMWIIDGDENDGASRGSGGRRVPRAGDKEVRVAQYMHYVGVYRSCRRLSWREGREGRRGRDEGIV